MYSNVTIDEIFVYRKLNALVLNVIKLKFNEDTY